MSTWADRDLPVLFWLNESPPQHGILATDWQSGQPHGALAGLSERDVHASVETLADEGLVTYSNREWESSGGVMWMQFQVTGAGLQALGEWPVFDVLESPEDLGRLLESLAEMAESDHEEENLSTAARAARSKTAEALRALAAGALREVIRSQLG